jgi:hypothetical protein
MGTPTTLIGDARSRDSGIKKIKSREGFHELLSGIQAPKTQPFRNP